MIIPLRAYQQVNVKKLLNEYQMLPFDDQRVILERGANGTVLLRLKANAVGLASDGFPLKTSFWRLDVDGAACGRSQIGARMKYTVSKQWDDFSRSVLLDVRNPVGYLFYTFEMSGTSFSGIELNENDLPCIKKFGRLQGFDKLPLLMNLKFQQGWENKPLYQTIGRDDPEIELKWEFVSTLFLKIWGLRAND